MKGNLYCLYDKVSHRYSHFKVCDNEAMYIREMIAHRVSFPMNFDDFKVISLGYFDQLLDDVKPRTVEIPWTAWRYPETKAELLAPLGLTTEEYSEIITNNTLKQGDNNE